MWKKYIWQLGGWTILGGGACTAGYFAWKNDIFKTSAGNALLGTNDVNETTTEEETSDLASSNIPDASIDLQKSNQEASQTIDISDKTETRHSNTDSFHVVTESDLSTQSEKLIPENPLSDNRSTVNTTNVIADTTKNTPELTVFYEFSASQSTAPSNCYRNCGTDYSIEILTDISEIIESTIRDVNIYSFVNDQKNQKLAKTTFQDGQKYLIEIKKADVTRLETNKAKKMRIVFDNADTVTNIMPNNLKKYLPIN